MVDLFASIAVLCGGNGFSDAREIGGGGLPFPVGLGLNRKLGAAGFVSILEVGGAGKL